jgi:hypothetical protein
MYSKTFHRPACLGHQYLQSQTSCLQLVDFVVDSIQRNRFSSSLLKWYTLLTKLQDSVFLNQENRILKANFRDFKNRRESPHSLFVKACRDCGDFLFANFRLPENR